VQEEKEAVSQQNPPFCRKNELADQQLIVLCRWMQIETLKIKCHDHKADMFAGEMRGRESTRDAYPYYSVITFFPLASVRKV